MPQGALQIYGTEKMAALGRELAVIGGPSARGIRRNLRVGIVAEVRPLQREVQAAYRAVSVADSSGSTGLRQGLAKATKLRILASSRNAVVRVYNAHPLAAVWEGTRPWRKPLFGDREHWYPQASHPTFYRTVNKKVGAIRTATVAAIIRTTSQLPREM